MTNKITEVNYIKTKLEISHQEVVEFNKNTDISNFIANLLKEKAQEHFYVLYKSGNQLYSYHAGIGNIYQVLPSKIEIIRHAILSGCDEVYLAHNHIGKELTPSVGDLNFTKELCELAKPLGIMVIDHFIVNSWGETYSMLYDGSVKDEYVVGKIALRPKYLEELKQKYWKVDSLT